MEQFPGRKITIKDGVADKQVDPHEAFLLNRLPKLEANLSGLGAAEWTSVEQAVKAKGGDEAYATASVTLDMLKSIKSLQDKTDSIKRAGKKLPELAAGLKILNETLPENDSVRWAAQFLVDAVHAYAPAELQSEAGQILGTMSDADLEAAKERASKMNIQ